MKTRPANREEIKRYFILCAPFHEEIHKRRLLKESYQDVIMQLKEAREQAGFFVSEQGMRINSKRMVRLVG